MAAGNATTIGFLKYLLYRVGARMFWFGLVGFVLILYLLGEQMEFYLTGIDVEATVDRVETNCTLSWKELGHRAHADMDCAEARAIKASNPSIAYSISEHTSTQLVYMAPDGTPMKQWSHIAEVDGHKLVRGDRLTAVVGSDDYADIRGSFDAANMMLGFVLLIGSLVVLIVGWAFKGTATGSLSWRSST